MSSNRSLHWFAFALVLLEFATYASNDMVLPAMPGIVVDFKGALYQIPMAMSLYILGCASFQLFVAPFADYYGIKRTLLLGAAYFIVTTFVIIFSKSMPIFLSIRFIAGMGMAVNTLGYSVIHTVYNDKEAAKLTSLMQNFAIISPVLGPMIGIFIIQHFSWHYIFIFSSFLGVLSFFGIRHRLPALPYERRKFNLKALVKDYATIIKNKLFFIGILSCILITLPYLIWIAFSTTVIKETLRLSNLDYVLLQFIALGGAFFSAIIMHLFSGKISFFHMMTGGVIFCVAGLSFSLFAPDNMYVIAWGMSLYGIGVGLYNTLATRIIGTIPFPKQPMIFTLFAFTQLVGFFVAITLMEFLFEYERYAVRALAISNAIFIACVLLVGPYFVYVNRKRMWQ